MEAIDRWHHTRQGHLLFGLAELAIAYGFASWAIDSGRIWQYLLAFIFFYPDEKAAFLPFLKQQLQVIKPKLVVTLGRHSMEVLLPAGLRISQCHGQAKRYSGQVYMPLFHPAAALYNGSMRQTLVDDFAKIPKVLAAINKGSK
jgi:hypothetical protein